MSSPLVDLRNRIGNWFRKEDQPAKKPDTADFARRVSEANESFRQAAERDKAKSASTRTPARKPARSAPRSGKRS